MPPLTPVFKNVRFATRKSAPYPGPGPSGTDPLQINVPAGTVANDLLIAVLRGPPTHASEPWIPPTGWTLQATALHQSVMTKVADGSEEGTIIDFSPEAADLTIAVGEIYLYGNVDPVNPVVGASGHPICETGSDGVCRGFAFGTSGSMTAAGDVLTIAGTTFSSADVGRGFSIAGAGPAGANLVTHAIAFVDSTHMQMAHAATNTVSSVAIRAGKDGERINEECPCPDFYPPGDIEADVGGCLNFYSIIAHALSYPFIGPAGMNVRLNNRINGDDQEIGVWVGDQVLLNDGVPTVLHVAPADTGWDHAAAIQLLIRPLSEIPPLGGGAPPSLFIGDRNEYPEPVTPEVDLNEVEFGATEGFFVRDWPREGLDWGYEDPELHVIEAPGWKGAAYAGRTERMRTAHIPLMLEATSHARMLEMIQEASESVDRPGVLVWQPEGEDPTYVDFLPGAFLPLMDGRERSQHEILTLGQDPDAMLNLPRQPWTRRKKIPSAASEQLSNTYNEHAIEYFNPGSTASPCIISVAPNDEDEPIVRWRAGLKTQGNLDEYLKNVRGFIAWDCERVDATHYFGSDQVAPDASSGHIWRFSFPGGGPYPLTRIVRFEAVPEDRTALIGVYRVFLIVRQELGFVARYQLRWGIAAGEDPVANPNDPQPRNSIPEGSGAFAPVDLGLVSYDEDGDALVLELWIEGDADATGKDIDLDQVILIPADEGQITVAEPTFLSVQDPDVWTASQLIQIDHGNLPSTGANRDGTSDPTEDEQLNFPGLTADSQHRVMGNRDMVGSGTHADVTDEGVGTPWMELVPGLHIVTFQGSIQENDLVKTTVGYLFIRKDAGGTGTTYTNEEAVAITSRAGSQWTAFGYVTQFRAQAIFEVTDPDDLWQFQAIMTADRKPNVNGAAASRKLWARGFGHQTIRSTGPPEALVADGWHRRGEVVNGNQALTRLARASGFLDLPPGRGVLVFMFERVPTLGLPGAMATGPVGQVTSTSRLGVTIDIIPLDRPVD